MAALAGCGSSSSSRSSSGPSAAGTAGAGGAAKAAADQIKNYAFIPASITVRAGARVVFTNRDATAHTATATDRTFDTGTLKPGQSRTVTLSKPGTYAFYCQFHAFMQGKITVTG
jgi:plastocyanin